MVSVAGRSATAIGLAAAQAWRRAPAAPAVPRRHVAEGRGGPEHLDHRELDLGSSPPAVQALERHPHQTGGADSPAAIGAVEHPADRAPDESLGGVRQAHGTGTPRQGIVLPAHAPQVDLARRVMRPGARKRSAMARASSRVGSRRSRWSRVSLTRQREQELAPARPAEKTIDDPPDELADAQNRCRHPCEASAPPPAPEREHLVLYDI